MVVQLFVAQFFYAGHLGGLIRVIFDFLAY